MSRWSYPGEYGLANRTEHPSNVYVAEPDVLPVLDGWLAGLFAPTEYDHTVTAMWESPADEVVDPAAMLAERTVAECDARPARYRAALEAGADPALVVGWTTQVQSERAAALGAIRVPVSRARMSRDEIRSVVDALDNVHAVLVDADAGDKAEVYRQLGLRLTYRPDDRTVQADVRIDAQPWGFGLCPRGDMNSHTLHPCVRQGFMWITISRSDGARSASGNPVDFSSEVTAGAAPPAGTARRRRPVSQHRAAVADLADQLGVCGAGLEAFIDIGIG